MLCQQKSLHDTFDYGKGSGCKCVCVLGVDSDSGWHCDRRATRTILCILQSAVASRMTARQTDRGTATRPAVCCLSSVVCSCCGVDVYMCVCVCVLMFGWPAVIISDHNKSWQCAKWVHGRSGAPFRFCSWHTYFSLLPSPPPPSLCLFLS